MSKKVLRKLLSSFLIVCFLVSALPGTVIEGQAAQGTEGKVQQLYAKPISVTNPLYPDETAPVSHVSSVFYGSYNGADYYESQDEVAAYLRQELKKRNPSIMVRFQMAYTGNAQTYVDENFGPFVEGAMNKAMQHTQNPTEGDYIKWVYGGWSASSGGIGVSGGNLYFTVTYNVNYYTTLEQEQELDAKVEEVLEELDLDADDDYTKICKIYQYLCDHIEYDHKNLNDDTYKLKHTAYAALINGTSVCQGYAVLLYRMLLMVGIDNRVITGIGGTGTDAGPHAWNIIKIGDKYYNVDSTWDANYKDHPENYQWFLKGSKNFPEHERDNGVKEYTDGTTKYDESLDYVGTKFVTAYPTDTDDYVYVAHTHTWDTGTVTTEPDCTTKGKTTYTCTGCGETKVEEDVPATGHLHKEIRAAVAAGCVTDGYTGDTWCTDCETKIESGTVIAAVGHHTWNEGTVTKKPTVSAEGEKEFTCTVCSEKKKEAIPKLESKVSLEGKIQLKGTKDSVEGITLTVFDGTTEKLTVKTDASGNYAIRDLEDGTYTMTVSKKNYATRKFEFTVKDGVTDKINTELHLLGDINGDGKADVRDLNRICIYLRGTTAALKEYELACADIDGTFDGVVDDQDLDRIGEHLSGTNLLWE